MKFFIDTANLEQIKEAQALGVLDGVTTNPSLMAKDGITGPENILEHNKKICHLVAGDVSTAVNSNDLDGKDVVVGRVAEISSKNVKKMHRFKEKVKKSKYYDDKEDTTTYTEKLYLY